MDGQNLLDQLAAASISEEQFDALIERTLLEREIEALRAAHQATVQAYEAALQTRRARIDELNQIITG